MSPQNAPAARVFLSYAHQDEKLRRALGTHLAPLERLGVVATWHDREVLPGSEWAGEIDRELERADLVLLLVSPDFVASDYCYEIEMERALARHRAGEGLVVPVILRPCDWQACPFARLAALPADGRPVTAWDNLDLGQGRRPALRLRPRALPRSAGLRRLAAGQVPGDGRGVPALRRPPGLRGARALEHRGMGVEREEGLGGARHLGRAAEDPEPAGGRGLIVRGRSLLPLAERTARRPGGPPAERGGMAAGGVAGRAEVPVGKRGTRSRASELREGLW